MPQLDREEGPAIRNEQAFVQPASASIANSLAGLVHDARNIVAAMDLYCDLLAEPEVLSNQWRHYAADLRLVSGAGRRLLDKLAATAAQTSYLPGTTAAADAQRIPEAARSKSSHPSNRPAPTPFWPDGFHPNFPAIDHESTKIERVCDELRRILPLLSAIAGPGVSIEIADSTQDWPLPLDSEDLTRIMVNLVRNASEAMSGSGHIRIAVEETAGFVVLSIADDGPGIPRELMERIFQAGFSTRESQSFIAAADSTSEPPPSTAWPVKHRGLGLSIVRSIVSAARGTVWAANGTAPQSASVSADPTDTHAGGAVIFLEFPLPNKTPEHSPLHPAN
ncbi:ATP-binding protein [Acidicapsa dinghuensis]|uniref:histidine kinase n=1 Tax=Acidicapsa dinghuensis TaxID=2218256 RepID=A0ABW1EJ89_9BACT|nr:ATP-binding protein [Acidicapsa dinghuensis]